jgi:hypothetical protein
METGTNLFQYAKSIRKDGEKWADTVKRANKQMKEKGLKFQVPKNTGKPAYMKKQKSKCAGLKWDKCTFDENCHWIKQSTDKNGQIRKAHCAMKPQKIKSKNDYQI